MTNLRSAGATPPGRSSSAAALLCLACLLGATAAAAQPAVIGEYVHQTFESRHPYAGSADEGAVLRTSQTIEFDGATYIAPHFAKFDLPEGDYVVVRSPDSQQRWEYRGYGRRQLGIEGGFFATHIKGDTAIVELYSSNPAGGYGYLIDYFGRGFNDGEIANYWARGLGEKMNLVEPSFNSRSVCTTADWTEAAVLRDASDGDLNLAWQTSRAVARLTLNGAAHCTGWLVGDEGHIMTNEHCITSQGQTNSIDFEFLAEGATAGTNCQSALACPGTIEASGGTFITDNVGLDYALVLPDTSVGGNTDLVSTYGRFQLRDTPVDITQAGDAAVFHPQHPSGWGKQIVYQSTYPDDPANDDDFPGNTVISSINEPACDASSTVPELGYWHDTAGGSSGSPVVAWSDHKVVALHHCRGSAFCTTGNPGSDDRNRGVPIPDIIADLGSNLPAGAVCDAPDSPTNPGADAQGDNEIQVTWDVMRRGVVSNVERALGTCASNSGFSEIAGSIASPYLDTDVSGGSTYAYRMRQYDVVAECSSLPSTCVEATATGVCTLAPDFAGITAVASAGTSQCGTTVSWATTTDRCGGLGDVVYNVYRSTTSGFTPDGSTLVDSCVAGTSWTDTAVLPGVEYFYVVRAEDNSGNGAGPCRGGNEDANLVEESAQPAGPPQITFEDDVEAADQFTAEALPGDTGTAPWDTTTTDAHSPTHSWFVSDEAVVKDQVIRTTNPVVLPANGGAVLSFWHHYNSEATYDGGVLEISTDGGSTWLDILDGNPDRFLSNGYVSAIDDGFSSPIGGRLAWHGDSGGFLETTVDLDDFAGQTVQLRWRFACDTSISDVGWWVDDFVVSTATECVAPNIFGDTFETGDTGEWGSTSP